MKNNTVKNNFFIVLTVIALLMTGCSRNVGLSGKVTFSDDGSPLTAGTVAFQKDGQLARAALDENGNYVVGFEMEKNGLPPGRWEVFITGADEVIGTEPGSTTVIRKPLIDEKFRKPETSGLVLEVDSSTKTFDFQVDRFKK